MLFPLKITIFAHPNHSGCSSARLEYTSGGRVVAGSNPVIPTKPSEARRCRKTSFCFLCLVASLLADNGVKNKSKLRSNLLAEIGFRCPRGKRDWKGVKRSRRSLRSSQSSLPDKLEQTAEQCVLLFFVVESLGSLEKLEKLEKLGKLEKLESLGNPLIFTNHFHQACKNNCRSPN